MKIVSLVPSYTRLLCNMGLKDCIIGITNFCVDPADLHRSAERVGGTKDPDINLIIDLKPDVVFVNTEENRSEDIALLKHSLNVHESCPKNVEDAVDLISSFYSYLKMDCPYDLENYHKKIKEIRKTQTTKSKVLYFIWKKPYMCASKGSYINSVLELAGYINAAPIHSNYPMLEIAEITSLDVDMFIFSDEPYPFRKRDCKELDKQLHSKNIYMKADAKLFSWHGSHTLEVIDILHKGGNLLTKM